MLTKILITALLVGGALLALRVFGKAAETRVDRTKDAARDAVRRRMEGEDLVKCPACGAWVPKGETCSCGETPTP